MSDDFPSIDSLRWESPSGPLAPITSSSRHTEDDREGKRPFLKGPIPWDWILKAMHLGKGLAVGLVIWRLYAMRKTDGVKLSRRSTACIGSRKVLYRSLSSLESAGLVRVVRQKGKNPTVFIQGLDTLRSEQ